MAGLIGALYALTRSLTIITPGFPAAAGVLLHALAGEEAAKHLGEHATMASDIAYAIGQLELAEEVGANCCVNGRKHVGSAFMGTEPGTAAPNRQLYIVAVLLYRKYN